MHLSLHDGVAWDVTRAWRDHGIAYHVLVLLDFMTCIFATTRVDSFPPATPPLSFPPLDLKISSLQSLL